MLKTWKIFVSFCGSIANLTLCCLRQSCEKAMAIMRSPFLFQPKKAMTQINDHLVLLCGKSATGKSASLMNLEKPEGVMYLNCESGKRLPFRSKFKEYTVNDPLQVYEAFQAAEKMEGIHTIVVDSLSMLMEMYESVYVVNSANTMKA